MWAPPEKLELIAFEAISGFDSDDLEAALSVFKTSARRLLDGRDQQRPALPPPPSLVAIAQAALEEETTAPDFFRRWFLPFRLPDPGFVTAYYEPEVEARRLPSSDYTTPVLARPEDLVTLNETPLILPTGEILTSARKQSNGAYIPYPDRQAIEEQGAAIGAKTLAYVRDPVELFLLQVQGSARLKFDTGESVGLTYDGRNGWPYTSIGKRLIETGIVRADEMSLDRLKATVREMGVAPGAPGRRLMQENRSYVFFALDETSERRLGPIGGEGCALTPLRSIAIDRSLWCYGAPFWISTRIPWRNNQETPFDRLMIAQDTGSAILGAARADLFFGSGDQAGQLAGAVRHKADFIVLLPKESLAL